MLAEFQTIFYRDVEIVTVIQAHIIRHNLFDGELLEELVSTIMIAENPKNV